MAYDRRRQTNDFRHFMADLLFDPDEEEVHDAVRP
jgi:hypothetical protein